MQKREKCGKGKKSERKGPKNKNKKRETLERAKEKKGDEKKIKKKSEYTLLEEVCTAPSIVQQGC